MQTYLAAFLIFYKLASAPWKRVRAETVDNMTPKIGLMVHFVVRPIVQQ